MKSFFRQNEKGLTLVEVVVATLLLSIGILTALTLLSTGITVNAINRDKVKAMNIAEQHMEIWKYRDLSQPDPDFGYSGYGVITDISNDDTYYETDGDYNVEVILNPSSDLPPDPDTLVTLKINVSWTQNGTKEVSLVTVRQFDRN